MRTTGHFSLEKRHWGGFPNGVHVHYEIRLPRCPNCSAMKINKPTGYEDHIFKNLHIKYAEAILIANPDLRIKIKDIIVD